MHSKVQIKVVNDKFKDLIYELYPNLTFNYEYNLYNEHLDAILTIFPQEIIFKIYNKEHFFALYVADEALNRFVDDVYQQLIIKHNFPESQIILICSSPDYKKLIEDKANFYHREKIKALYISVFEHQQKQLFLWYMTNKDEKNLHDCVLPYKSALLNNNFKKKYLCFNRRWKEHRFAIVSLLNKKNLIKDGLISFSKQPVNYDDLYYGDINAFDKFLNDTNNLYNDKFETFYDLLPLHVDSLNFETYFAFDSNHRLLKKHFNETYFSLVNETFFDYQNVRFLTEKIYKPIMHKHPFLLVSSPYSLELLREQGYETFDGIIDESYDKISDNNKRLNLIIKETERLCNLSQQELKTFCEFCLPIVEHNYRVFFEKQIKIYQL